MVAKQDKIENVKTNTLIFYAKNSRTHSDIQVQQIAGSIREFGFLNPVLIDGENSIIAGHGRVMAASILKMDTVPCRRIKHLTDAQKRAYVIADNRLALNAGWDEAMLANELSDLRADDFDLGLLGFDADELSRLLQFEGMSEEPKDKTGLDVGEVAYRVVVLTTGEQQQSELIQRLEQEGFQCQPLMS